MNPEETSAHEPISPSEIERRRLNVLLEKHQEELGGFYIHQVGEAGWIISREKVRPMAGNNWCFFDYDDTLAAYTESKDPRLTQLHQLLKKSIGIDDEDFSRQIMKLTDQFSRWEEKPGRGRMYHANAHMAALSWGIQEIKNNSEDLESAIQNIQTTLERISQQRQEKSSETEATDPFHFKGNQLILHSKKPWSKEVESIFEKHTINPALYQDVIEAGTQLAAGESIHRLNLGVLTYGDPYFQLSKVLNLLKENPDFPISQIWLTKAPKGEFIKGVVSSGVVSQTQLDYVPSELEEHPFDSISYGFGYPFGQHDHVVLLFDDDPKQLVDVTQSNEFLEENTGAQIVAVRSKRPNTKAEKREWRLETQHGTADFISQEITPQQLALLLQMNLYLNLKSREEPLNQYQQNYFQQLERELKKQGLIQ